MESEIELNDAIQELHVVATQSDLYHVLVNMNGITLLISLLTHENADISIAVISLIQELTDVDTITESEQQAALLIDALVNSFITKRRKILVYCLYRLNNKLFHYLFKIWKDLMKILKKKPMVYIIRLVKKEKSKEKTNEITFLILAIVENMTEFRPTLCIDACKQGLLACLLKRLKVRRQIKFSRIKRKQHNIY